MTEMKAMKEKYTDSMYVCAACGEMFAEEDLLEFDGETYCADCLDERTDICACCGERSGIRIDGVIVKLPCAAIATITVIRIANPAAYCCLTTTPTMMKITMPIVRTVMKNINSGLSNLTITNPNRYFTARVLYLWA